MTGLALVSEGPVTEEEIKGRKIEEEVKKRRGISVKIFPPTSCGWEWGKRPLPPPAPAKKKREGRKRKKGELKGTKKEEEEKKGEKNLDAVFE